MLSLIRFTDNKISKNPFRILGAYYSFFLIHLELKRKIRLTALQYYLENYTQVQTKIGKGCTRFQTTTAPKNIPSGAAHTYKETIIKGVTPRMSEVPGRGFQKPCRLFLLIKQPFSSVCLY